MSGLLRLTSVLALCAFGCGGAQTSRSPQPVAPPPDVLAAFASDPARAACVADDIARIAERNANRQQLLEARSRAAEIDARTSSERADRARAHAVGTRIRAVNAAAASPTNQALRAAASYADANAALSLSWAEHAETRAAAVARAREAVAGTARAAQRFAELAATHARLFDLQATPQDDRTDDYADRESRATAEIGSISEEHPDFQWLHVEQLLGSYEVPPDRCLPDATRSD